MTHPLPTNPDWADAAEAIAVVGMAGRFPGAADLDAFWSGQLAMDSGIRDLTREQLLAAGRSEAELARTDFVARTGSIGDVDRFDAPFFGFTAREAEVMDPQIRLMHELAWHSVENAGLDLTRPDLRVGVFATTHMSTYWLYNMAGRYRDAEPNELLQIAASNAQDYPATTVAYRLGLTGPALNILTACSSGLVTVTTACQNLMDGSCDAALALAVSVTLPADSGSHASAESIYSPDGTCRPFDADANGTIAGDGAVGVVLRRLSDAEADGDRILGVIRGWAVNNDGRRKIGFTAPSSTGQREVLAEAAAMAGFAPGDIDYIEAHGTGTTLGDPIEVEAIRAVHGQPAPDRRIAIGSVKGALGHLGGAAGLAGFARTVLGLHHAVMPGTLNHSRLSPRIDLAGSPLHVQAAPGPFPDRGRARRAGVSSFGIGGTNAHVVVESRETALQPARHHTAEPLGLSAPDAAGLERRRLQLVDWLSRGVPAATEHGFADAASLSDASLLDLQAHPFRMAVTGSDADGLATALQAVTSPVTAPDHPHLCMVFTGSGVPSGITGRLLAQASPAFAAALDEVEDTLADLGLPSARDWLGRDDTDERQLVEAHTAAFAFGYAQAAMWRSAGLQPHAVIGHSMGEIAAACVAGAIDLRDALQFVGDRARIILDRAEPGDLLVAAASPDQVRPLIPAGVEIAGNSGIGQTLLAGSTQAIRDLAARLAEGHIPSAIPPAGQAFHSNRMIGASAAIGAAASRFRAAAIPVCSTVTGLAERDAVGSAGHWAAQMTRPVLLEQAIAAAAGLGCTAFLELGPRPVLTSGGGKAARQQNPDALWISAMAGAGRDAETLAAAIAECRARLFAAGFVTTPPHRDRARRTALPPYPFARNRYWIGPPPAVSDAAAERPAVPSVAAAAVAPAASTPQSGDDLLRDHLAALWRDELGVRLIADADSFIAQGGSSLAALRLIGSVEQSLGVRPPVSVLVDNSSFASFVATINELLVAEQTGTNPERVEP